MGGKTVVLGLSGGVDSAVAARLLQEQGYTVYGHWLDIGLGGREDAQQVAETFGIPFSAGDIRRELEASVMGSFQRDYLAGRTPLPCARCSGGRRRWGRTGWPPGTMRGLPPDRRGSRCSAGAPTPMTRPICWPGCPNTGCPAWCFPSAGMKRPRFGSWPGTLDCRWRRNRTAWKSASFRTATTPPGWRPEARCRRRAILWTGPAGCWAGTGVSIAIPSVSAGGWVSRRPTGCLSRRSARRPRRWSSPTARTLWRTRSGGRTLTRWPL